MLLAASGTSAQELFVYTEPASNMPAKSLGIRVSNWLMNERMKSTYNYHLIPELMWGINKNLMLHTEGFLSNRNGTLKLEGAAVYAKYRFFSKDAVNRHFRMAGYGRMSINNAEIHQEEIETNGHNSGFETGIIATQLLHKLALSGSLSFEHALDNGKGNKFPAGQSRNAINYTLSAGRLILPRKYTSYKQTNMNIMVEALGQSLPGSGKIFIDLAPSVQFIINSQARIDLGYRKELYSNMIRDAPDGFLLRIEYLLFNVFN
jgi:hypothetical protein